MQDAQKQVADFMAQHGLEAGVEARLLDLQSEVGELAKEWLKASDYGQADFVPDEAWGDEIGDVAFSLLALSAASGTDLEAALAVALDKYRGRLADGGDAGSRQGNR